MNPATAAPDHKIVSRSEWLRARSEFLAKEKELTHLSDRLAQERRELPWTKVEKDYVFAGVQGKLSLAQLFDRRSQLATYHFMFGPDWDEGCPGCSYLMDHMDGAVAHLRARDVSFVLVSRAPVEKLMAFQKRMGWHFTWVSSVGSDFNRDFGVYFTKQEVDSGKNAYNFATIPPHGEENPGPELLLQGPPPAPCFIPFSGYGRGLESMLGTYAILDRAPKGRDEAGLSAPMSWVRHHDKYETTSQGAGSCCHEKESH